MSYLNKMYGVNSPQVATRDKNPNRVLGGLKGAGVNTFTMLDEAGTEKQIPTHAYVFALEEKLSRLERQINEQDKRIRGLSNDQKLDRNTIAGAVNR